MAGVDEKLIVDQHPFLVHCLTVRRHRSGSDAADVGMMAARGDIPGGIVILVYEYRHDDRDAGQVRPAPIGGVQDVNVARLHATSVRSEEHTSELPSLMRNSYAV